MSAHTIVDLTQSIKMYTDSGDSAQEALTRASVGWTGKNWLQNKATNKTDAGITFTVDSDGVITGNGTATANTSNSITGGIVPNSYIGLLLNGCSGNNNCQLNVLYYSTSSSESYVKNQLVTGTTDYEIEDYPYIRIDARVANGTSITDFKWYPMLRDARIKDPTFEPYHKSVLDYAFPAEAQGVLGAKNLYLFEAYDPGTNSQGTFSISDGVLAVTCAAVDYSGAYLRRDRLRPKFANLAGVPCIFSFMYKSSISCSGQIGLEATAPVVMPTEWTKKEILVSDPSNIGNIVFYNRDATKEPVISAKEFMLRLASDPDDTFATYAMTNKELTDKTIGTIYNPIKLTSTDDLNDLKTGGVYNIEWSTNPAHMPEQATAKLEVIGGVGVSITQRMTSSSAIYTRGYGGNPQTWSAWRKYTSTVME